MDLLSRVPVRASAAAPEERPARLPSARLWVAVSFAAMAALGAWLLIRPALGGRPYYRIGQDKTTFDYDGQLVLILIPYGMALWAWWRGSRVPLWALLAGAAVLHTLVLFAPLPQSQDFYQYLFYGKMQALHHVNPYVARPIAFPRDPWLAWVRWPDQPSVYGPLWMLVTLAVAKVAGPSLSVGFVALKMVILDADVAVAALILVIARGSDDPAGRAGWGVLLFLWNPLVFVNVPLGGAVDVVIAATFLGAYLADRRDRPMLATVLLTAASLLKIYAGVALLLYAVVLARRRGWRLGALHALVAASVASVAYLPYWSGVAVFRGVAEATTLTNVSLTGTRQLLVAPILHAAGTGRTHLAHRLVHLTAGAVLPAVGPWAIHRAWEKRALWPVLVGALFAYLVITPWFLPWYVIAPLALVAVLPRNRLTLPLIVFAATSLAVLWDPVSTSDWVFVSLVHYVPPAAVYAWELLRERAMARRPVVRVLPPGPEVRGPSALPTPGSVTWEPAAK